MLFEQVCIIGLGLIGFKLSSKPSETDSWLERLVAVDKHTASIETAYSRQGDRRR